MLKNYIEKLKKGGWIWVFCMSVIMIFLVEIPTLWGYYLQAQSHGKMWFTGFPRTGNDNYGYLSWVRVAADGSFFMKDIFVSFPNKSGFFHIPSLIAGNLARFTGMSVVRSFQITGIVCGFFFLFSVWWFTGLLVESIRTRKVLFLSFCFSSGLGWAFYLYLIATKTMTFFERQYAMKALSGDYYVGGEFINFLIFVHPLSTMSLIFLVIALGMILIAEKEKKMWPAIIAGIFGALIVYTHTYALYGLTFTWVGFLLIKSIIDKKFELDSWLRGLAAGAVILLPVCYVLYLKANYDLFFIRLGCNFPILKLRSYLFGFGIPFILAVYSIVIYFKNINLKKYETKEKKTKTGISSNSDMISPDNFAPLLRDGAFLLIAWIIYAFVLILIENPLSIKCMPGVYIPITIFSGLAIDYFVRNLNGLKRGIVLFVIFFIFSLTSWLTIIESMILIKENYYNRYSLRYFMYSGEIKALKWLEANAPPGVPIQPLPWIIVGKDGDKLKWGSVDYSLANIAPAITGHPVHFGHWTETLDMYTKMFDWCKFMIPFKDKESNEWKREFLKQTGVKYIIYSQKHDEIYDEGNPRQVFADFINSKPDYLRFVPEASNSDADVYEVVNLSNSGSSSLSTPKN